MAGREEYGRQERKTRERRGRKKSCGEPGLTEAMASFGRKLEMVGKGRSELQRVRMGCPKHRGHCSDPGRVAG